MIGAIFQTTSEYNRIKASLATPGPAALFGLPPAGRAALLAALAQDTGRILCVVTAGEGEAARFAADLSALGLETVLFPTRDYLLRPIEGANRESEYRRLAVLGDLVGGRAKAVCLSVEALLQFTVPKDEFCKNTLTLEPGQTIEQETLTQALADAGYHRRSQVEGPGQFSVRGGLVDIYAPEMKQPVRVEFWGDEIDSINTFDLLTQRREDWQEKVYLSCAREVLFGDAAQTAAALRSAISAAPARHRAAMKKAMEQDLAQLDGGLIPEALDKYLGIRYQHPATLLNYLENPILVLDELSSIRDAKKALSFRRGQEMEALFEEGVLCPGLDVLYPPDCLMRRSAHELTSLCTENFTRSMPDYELKELFDLPGHSLPVWNGEVAGLVEDLKPLLDQGYGITVLTGTQKAAAALAGDLRGRLLKPILSETDSPAPGLVQVLPGHMGGGCQFPFARYAIFTGRTQGESGKKKKARKNKNALNSLTDIVPGDYVVHQNHGIGVYAGITRMEVQGVKKDYLKICYDKGDNLYVPVTQLDLLSRYTAPGDTENVKLSRLGGDSWAKTRKKIRAATVELAQELIQLYARRRQAKGYAFPEDDTWQRDFETRFPYDETEDQLRAVAEIKGDMEKEWPMDRLLCGDVGVGKTEVALRAAFKCIMGGKQCVLLAPTTLLAWQHYNTIINRMESFPIKVGLLNRFRTQKQQQETLRGLRSGVVDMVVGTHRILSQDVKFKDLGLVIIDEEQRFGVKQKEKLKESFIGVDILTLSATPIPRTLNMAMSGLRDMSTIEEPPFERLPIETYVLEYDSVLVTQAIRKELARGGQVYYLHNRVDTIENCAARLAKMVPEARIAIAHGKMTEEQIGAAWKQLLDGEIDLLVCTTIIETGVDVRNCNTLIIEDADRMGLSQLYQIRGRVGRSNRKAYAYFTFKRDKALTDVAAKRLSAIREFTSFGSGFRIAMRDLQIRGAGSLLGTGQSGQMMSVGYDMYVKMLGQAIAVAKGETPPPDKSQCLVDITVDAYIPENYIQDPAHRIEMYKKIAAIQDRGDATDVMDELIDRWGEPPASVSGLVDVSLIRVTAARVGVDEIAQKGQNLLLYSQFLTPARIKDLATQLPGRITLGAVGRTYLSIRVQPGEKPTDLLRMTLDLLPALPQNP